MELRNKKGWIIYPTTLEGESMERQMILENIVAIAPAYNGRWQIMAALRNGTRMTLLDEMELLRYAERIGKSLIKAISICTEKISAGLETEGSINLCRIVRG